MTICTELPSGLVTQAARSEIQRPRDCLDADGAEPSGVAGDPVKAGCAPYVPRRAGREDVCAGQRDIEQPPPEPCAQVRILLGAQVEGSFSSTPTTDASMPPGL